eukprot:4241589-Pyramimonas_sp.AAC.1
MARGFQKARLKEPNSNNKITAIRCFRSRRHFKDGMHGPIVFAAPIPLDMRFERRSVRWEFQAAAAAAAASRP